MARKIAYFVGKDGTKYVHSRFALPTDTEALRLGSGDSSQLRYVLESIEANKARQIPIDQLPVDNGPYSYEFEPLDEPMRYVYLPDDLHLEVMHNFLVMLESEDSDAIVEVRANASAWGPMEDYVRLAANLVLGEVAAWCNRLALRVRDYPISEERLAHAARCLLWADSMGLDKNRALRHVIDRMAADQTIDPDVAMAELETSSDSDELDSKALEAVSALPTKVSEYRSGKLGIANMFVGVVMKATGGKYRANDVKSAIDRALAAA
jgi:Asp-tRNA(Asn)/Glu-tRNA(Gln) amidotransferase B subunit